MAKFPGAAAMISESLTFAEPMKVRVGSVPGRKYILERIRSITVDFAKTRGSAVCGKYDPVQAVFMAAWTGTSGEGGGQRGAKK